MNINDLMYYITHFILKIRLPQNPKLKTRHVYDAYISGLDDADFWHDETFTGFKLEKGENGKLILNVYRENLPGKCMNRYEWKGTEEDYKLFIERYEDLYCNFNDFVLYSLFGVRK